MLQITYFFWPNKNYKQLIYSRIIFLYTYFSAVKHKLVFAHVRKKYYLCIAF